MFHGPFKLNFFFFLMNCMFVHNIKKLKNKLSLDRRSTFIFKLMNAFISPTNVNELILYTLNVNVNEFSNQLNFLITEFSDNIISARWRDYNNIIHCDGVLTMCIAELRGRCGSISSWEGVWPKQRIWFSMASLIIGSVIVSMSTLPSYVK